MRYCKYLSSENDTSFSRYALVEKRNGELWATLPMQAPQEDLSSRILGGLPVPTLSVNFEPTLATSDALRLSPIRCRKWYTASMPVQWAPSTFSTPNDFILSLVQSSWASVWR